MSCERAAAESVHVLIAIWFVGLGLAIIFGVPGHYMRRTKVWLLWPLALLLQAAKRWLRSLLKAFVHWVIHHARHW